MLSQPCGRSQSGQCDFPPPGFVATATLHKARLSALPLGKSILSRTHPRSCATSALRGDSRLGLRESAVAVTCVRNVGSGLHAPIPAVLLPSQQKQTHLWSFPSKIHTVTSRASSLAGGGENETVVSSPKERGKNSQPGPGLGHRCFYLEAQTRN